MYVLVCNIVSAHPYLRRGARCVLLSCPGDPSRCLVSGLSRGGRRVEAWINAGRDAGNWRPAWMGDTDPLLRRSGVVFATREEAAAYAAGRGLVAKADPAVEVPRAGGEEE